jgi:hypothetical protein
MREATGGLGDGHLRSPSSACSAWSATRSSRTRRRSPAARRPSSPSPSSWAASNNVLLLDEPTNNLDPGSRTAVADALSGLGRHAHRREPRRRVRRGPPARPGAAHARGHRRPLARRLPRARRRWPEPGCLERLPTGFPGGIVCEMRRVTALILVLGVLGVSCGSESTAGDAESARGLSVDELNLGLVPFFRRSLAVAPDGGGVTVVDSVGSGSAADVVFTTVQGEEVSTRRVELGIGLSNLSAWWAPTGIRFAGTPCSASDLERMTRSDEPDEVEQCWGDPHVYEAPFDGDKVVRLGCFKVDPACISEVRMLTAVRSWSQGAASHNLWTWRGRFLRSRACRR